MALSVYWTMEKAYPRPLPLLKRRPTLRSLIFLLADTAGVSNIRPAGQIRRVAWLDPARGMILCFV